MPQPIDRLIVFGIGGSGERVMRSLVMLMAGGMELNCQSVQPVLIDSDKDSCALTKVKDLIAAYNTVRNLYDLEQPYVTDQFVKENSMFKTEIKSPILLNIDGTNVESLKKLVDKENMSKDLKAEFDVLYSTKSQDMKLSWGFVGNPSIGSIVLNQMLESDSFKNLHISAKDAVFIISSIFGGTGAAGFPLLVNKMRRHFEGNNVDGFRIGALSMFPYFSLFDANDDSEVGKELAGYDVNDRHFSTKTKAALSYYDKHVKALSSMYYLGTGDVSFRSKFPKFKGGTKQDNPAAMLELLGAKSVSHFTFNAKEITSEIVSGDYKDFTTYYEYFIEESPTNGKWYDLKSIDPDIKFREIFVRLQLMRYIWNDCVPTWINTKGIQWVTDIDMNSGRYSNMMGTYLNTFFSMFDSWKKELGHRYHDSGFKFRFFNDAEASADEQHYITDRFYPSIAYKKNEGFFSSKKVTKDPEILGKMQCTFNSNIGKGFFDDTHRYKYAFYTSLYAVEHIINDTADKRCINLQFSEQR